MALKKDGRASIAVRISWCALLVSHRTSRLDSLGDEVVAHAAGLADFLDHTPYRIHELEAHQAAAHSLTSALTAQCLTVYVSGGLDITG